MWRTRLYRHGVLEAEDFPTEDISDHLQDAASLVWLDLCEPTSAELAMVAEEFQLHELAVEDASKRRQRPKLDRYDTHLFLTAHAVRLDPASGELLTTEVSAFITRQALITVRADDEFSMEKVTTNWAASDGPIAGVGFLLYGLLDYVVDTHFTAVERLDDELERLEDLLFDDRPHDTQVQRRSFELRKSLVLLRRVALPMREVVNTLMRRDLSVVEATLMPYYQDIYDHVLRVTEWTESLRDLVSTVLETNLTIQGNRLNGIMKRVTSWAAVIAVPTAVTGFYGQNVPYPGYGHWSGFVVSSAVMVALSVGLFMVFRRRDWI
jgi:magnesium transporter